MFASVAGCKNVSTAHSHQESSNTDTINIRSEVFDFQQTVYTLQTNTQGRGSFMLVATLFEGAATVTCTSMLSDHSLTLKKWLKVKIRYHQKIHR